MNIHDLKKGMLLGWHYPNDDEITWFLYLGNNVLLGEDGFNLICEQTDDLKDLSIPSKGYDVVAIGVVDLKNCISIKDIFCTNNINIIWERKNPSMTPKEASDCIFRLTGERFDIKENE